MKKGLTFLGYCHFCGCTLFSGSEKEYLVKRGGRFSLRLTQYQICSNCYHESKEDGMKDISDMHIW